MSHEIPPVIQPPKTLIGVGLRELVLLVTFGLLTVLVFLLPVALPPRIGLGVLAALAGMLLTFGRDAQSGKPLEVVLRDRLVFSSRVRFWQRGARSFVPPSVPERVEVMGLEQEEPLPQAAPLRSAPKVQWRVRALPLTAFSWLSVGSLAALAALLAWVWLGGVHEILAWFGPGFGH